MAKYSQLVTLKVVPEDVKEIIHTLCVRWDTSGFGYKGKKYTENEQYQLQLLINSNIGETAIFYLLQQPDFILEVNALLSNYPNFPYNFLTNSGYMFNNATGKQTNAAHDLLTTDAENPNKKGWFDLVYDGPFDSRAIWSVEVKNTVSYSAMDPSNFHKADIVFVLYQDTGEIDVLIPMINDRKSRNDNCYIKAGSLTAKLGSDLFKKILPDWTITDF